VAFNEQAYHATIPLSKVEKLKYEEAKNIASYLTYSESLCITRNASIP
jgi:hypothetical protein